MEYGQLASPLVPDFNGRGGIKGHIAVMKFVAGLTTGVACLLGLIVTYLTRPKFFPGYVNNGFLTTLANAVAAGAAVGTMFGSYQFKAVRLINKRRRDLAEAHSVAHLSMREDSSDTVLDMTELRQSFEETESEQQRRQLDTMFLRDLDHLYAPKSRWTKIKNVFTGQEI